MNVALDKAKFSVKPGFGKIPDRPSFAKAGSVKAMFGTKDTAVTAQSSSLKKTVSSNIATSTRSSVFSSKSHSTSSSSFIPATRFMVASDFKRDRTETAAWGSIQGDHYIEGQTGVTKRSYRRMKEAAYGTPQQNTGHYTNFGNMYNQPISPLQILNELGSTVTSIIGLFRSEDGKIHEIKAGDNSAQKVAAAVTPTASTVPSSAGSITFADNTIDLQAAVGKAKNQQAALQKELSSADYQNVDANLQTSKDNKTQLDAQVTEQQGIVSNQQKTIDMLSGTRIPAQQSVVGNAEKALAQAQSMATAENPNDAAIKAAEQQLEEAKATLKQLEGQLKTAEETRDAAKAKLDGEDGLIAKQKEADNNVKTLTSLKGDKDAKSKQLATLDQTIKNAEQRQTKMLQGEEKKLDNLFKDLQKLDSKIKNEKDDTKKAKLKQEYAQLSDNFTSLAGKTTSSKYANASIDGASTFSETQQAQVQSNLQKMQGLADAARPETPDLVNKYRPKDPGIPEMT